MIPPDGAFSQTTGKRHHYEINELIVKAKDAEEAEYDKNDDNDGNDDKPVSTRTSCTAKKITLEQKKENAGKLILDATCTPADIHYPTALWLLNQVREALEKIIDVLYQPHIGNL